jgi:hypothetical protein
MGLKFLILGACHLATLYLYEKRCGVVWLLYEVKEIRIRNAEFFLVKIEETYNFCH